MTLAVARLDAAGVDARIDALVDLLCDAVDGGASVSFLPPMDRAKAIGFWRAARDAVARGTRALLVAEDGARLVGSVQVEFVQTPNQAHRVDIMKLLVLRGARRRGIGRLLMARAEAETRKAGRTLLVLDTRTGDSGEQLYRSMGWRLCGTIPRYARNGDGGLDATTIYWKEIA